MTNDAFTDVCVIALRLWSSSSSYAPLVIWEINWQFDYDLCDQVAICLRSERIATDLCASESTDGDPGDHGDQWETNQRSISALEELSVLNGAIWRSHRAPQIAGYWNGVTLYYFLLDPPRERRGSAVARLQQKMEFYPYSFKWFKPCLHLSTITEQYTWNECLTYKIYV